MKALSAALLLLATGALAGEPVRAGYEVQLTKGEDVWRASTIAPIEPGLPIQQGLGPYVVSMSVTEGKADRYTLLVRVTGLSGSPGEKAEFVRKEFAGDHRQQLEFAASGGELAVKGVIFVGPPKRAAK